MNRRFKFDRVVPFEHNSLKTFGVSPQTTFKMNHSYLSLVWNVFKGKKKQWKQDFDKMHRNFDLLLLQEAKINFNKQTIEHYDPNYNWVFGESFILNKCGSSCGVLTGSKVKETQAINKHAPTREVILNTPKSTTFTYYPIEDHSWEVLVINTHFINFRTVKAFEKQLSQILDYIDQHQGPILFAGDFNSWSGSRTREMFRAMELHGLTHIKMENERRSLFMLDHIFTRHFTINQARLLNTYTSSDHIPLSLKFEISF